MEDTMRNTHPSQSRAQKHKNYRHLQTDVRSVYGNPTMPEIRVNRLKTKMLGGQAETIIRIWGFDRALITKDAAVL